MLVFPEPQLGGHREAADGLDLRLHLRQDRGARRPRRQDVHTVPQHRAAALLQRPPYPHPHRRIARREAENERIESCHRVITITSQL